MKWIMDNESLVVSALATGIVIFAILASYKPDPMLFAIFLMLKAILWELEK